MHSAARVYETMLGRDAGNETLLRNAALGHKRLGAILSKEGRFPDALAHLRTAVAWDEQRVARHPSSVQARYDLSVSLVDLGVTLGNSGDWAGNLEQCQRALAIREELSRADSRNDLARQSLASVLLKIARANRGLGRHEEALRHLDRLEGLLGPGTEDAVFRADTYASMSVSLASVKRWDDAVRRGSAAVGVRTGALARQSANTWLRTGLAVDEITLGQALEGFASQKGRAPAEASSSWREAAAAYREALRIVAELAAANLLLGDDATLPDQARAGLARCERALASVTMR